MKIQMIRDIGVFKKGEVYAVSPHKAMALLTQGVCVNVIDEKLSTEKAGSQEKTVATNPVDKKITKKHSDKPSKEKPDVI